MSPEGQAIAVVTGASGGIGSAVVDRLGARGLKVIGVSRRPTGRTDRQCDVTDERAVEQLFADVVSRFGRLDVLVNCAGITAQSPLLEVPIEEWDHVMRTNVVGTYLCCRQAILAMLPRRSGRIVNVSSIAGRDFSRTASVAYTCSKYAVIGLTRQLAAAVAAQGITVNCVAPSQTRTAMLQSAVSADGLDRLAAATPIGRLAEPLEIGEAICFLTSDGASYINGAVLDVNGGQL